MYKSETRYEGKLPQRVETNGQLAHGRPSVARLQAEDIIANTALVGTVLFVVLAIAGEALMAAVGYYG